MTDKLIDISIDELMYDKPVYYRTSNTITNPNNFQELVSIIQLITGDNIISEKENFQPEYKVYDNNICLCGCNKCKELYLVHNTSKDIYITVGSSCINQFYDGFENDIKCLKRNGTCEKCNQILCKKSSKYLTKNVKKNSSICIQCSTKRCKDCRCEITDPRKFIIRCKRCWYNSTFKF